MGDLEDWEAGVVRDPRTPPQALADIAERRYDLHAAIAAHPRAYPELIRWMAAVNPASAPARPAAPQPGPSQPAPPQPASALPPAAAVPASSARFYPISAGNPAPPPRRARGIGRWLAGCGCLTLVVLLVVVLALGGIGALLSSSDDDVPAGQPADDEVVENLATYRTELGAIQALSADLEGNPVAPLILDQPTLDELAAEAADPELTVFGSRALAQEIGWVRANLEPLVSAAQQRRANASGSASEALVDQAGNGYIDIAWDAADHCGDVAEPDKVTIACPVGGSSPVLHLLPESSYPSTAALEHVVLHELAHLYQQADAARFDDRAGEAEHLIGQGLFNHSDESFADCYALTYQNLWTLSFGDHVYGYGYICDETERQAIREWAAALHVPLP